MNPCVTCGRAIRFKVMRITVFGKLGVSQWLATADGDKCPCLEEWAWTAFKPYPKPSAGAAKIAQWNVLNSQPACEYTGQNTGESKQNGPVKCTT